MAKFEDVLPEFKAGKRVKRADWEEDKYICIGDRGRVVNENGMSIVEPWALDHVFGWDNWEVIDDEPKRIKGYELDDITQENFTGKEIAGKLNEIIDWINKQGNKDEGSTPS